jgi:hypothetical protein
VTLAASSWFVVDVVGVDWRGLAWIGGKVRGPYEVPVHPIQERVPLLFSSPLVGGVDG